MFIFSINKCSLYRILHICMLMVIFTSVAQAAPVSWWTADLTTADAVDSNPGTLVGDTIYTAGKIGQAFQFDGNSDYVNVPSNTNLQIYNTVSIVFWAKRTNLNNIDIVLEKGGDWTLNSTNYGVGLHNSCNNYMFYFFYSGGWQGTPGVQDLNWHQYAAVAQNGQTSLTLYIDGTPYISTIHGGNTTITFATNNCDLHFGAQVGGFNYYSSIILDEIGIYNYALSNGDVQYIYQHGRDPVLIPHFNPGIFLLLD